MGSFCWKGGVETIAASEVLSGHENHHGSDGSHGSHGSDRGNDRGNGRGNDRVNDRVNGRVNGRVNDRGRNCLVLQNVARRHPWQSETQIRG